MSHEATPPVDGLLARPRSLAATFNQAASEYDARPGYPARVFELLRSRCGLGPATSALEIGPAVGQATLALIASGARVVAVEPGAELVRLLRQRIPDENLEVHVSTFEAADLAPRSFDVVCAATSFHWVDPTTGIAKAARVLRDGGWLALWWTIWGDPARPDAFADALLPILERKAPALTRDEHGPAAYRRDIEARIRMIDLDGSFGPVVAEQIDWEATHDPVSLRRLFSTFAAWIALSDDTRADLLDEVESLARDGFAGVVTRPYQTLLYLAQRRPRN